MVDFTADRGMVMRKWDSRAANPVRRSFSPWRLAGTAVVKCLIARGAKSTAAPGEACSPRAGGEDTENLDLLIRAGIAHRRGRGRDTVSGQLVLKRFGAAKFLALRCQRQLSGSRARPRCRRGKEFDHLLRWLVAHGASPDIQDRDESHQTESLPETGQAISGRAGWNDSMTSRARRRAIAIVGTSILMVLLVLVGRRVASILALGAAYKAKMLCSGIFVSGRDESTVLTDLQVDDLSRLRYIGTTVESRAQSVRASVLGLLTREAVYREGLGCALVMDGLIPPVPPAAGVVLQGAEAGDWPATPAAAPAGGRLTGAFAGRPGGPVAHWRWSFCATDASLKSATQRASAPRRPPGWSMAKA
jgi:hypothetical protein